MTGTAVIRPALPVWGLLAALAGFLALQAVAAFRAGVFEYPLDDVYIHLAMAETIAHGTYGVNTGEPASASSSILYPLLLLPFPGTELQRWLPFFWNMVAVAGCGWVWGRIAETAALTGGVAMAVVLAGPVFLNMSGVGFTGMESALHMLGSLTVLYGLWLFLTQGRVAPWLVAAAILTPLLRFEGLALSLSAAAVLALGGRRGAAALIAVVVIGLVAGFALFLTSIGLPPLPGSILAKTSGLAPGEGPLMRALVGSIGNLSKPAGLLLAGLITVLLALALALPTLRRGPAAWLVGVSLLSGMAHLVLGQVGWMHRYEPYAIAGLVATLLLGSAGLSASAARAMRGLAVGAILVAGLVYMPALLGIYLWNPRAVHLQQAQMARLVRDYLKVPVAVNDLGRVAWGNPDYVLDLWGLGSNEVMNMRFSGERLLPGWAEPLAAEHGVRAAMIYDSWFGEAVGPDWVRTGTLTMARPEGQLGDWTVSFYATDPAYAPEMRAKLEEFAPTLPEGAVLVLAEGQ